MSRSCLNTLRHTGTEPHIFQDKQKKKAWGKKKKGKKMITCCLASDCHLIWLHKRAQSWQDACRVPGCQSVCSLTTHSTPQLAGQQQAAPSQVGWLQTQAEMILWSHKLTYKLLLQLAGCWAHSGWWNMSSHVACSTFTSCWVWRKHLNSCWAFRNITELGNEWELSDIDDHMRQVPTTLIWWGQEHSLH